MHMIVPSRESILCVSTRHGTTKTRLKPDVSALCSFNNLRQECPLINMLINTPGALVNRSASARRGAALYSFSAGLYKVFFIAQQRDDYCVLTRVTQPATTRVYVRPSAGIEHRDAPPPSALRGTPAHTQPPR